MADPYHVDTDPDPGSENILYGSGPNFDTDPDPGSENILYGSGQNFDTDPDPGKKEFSTRKILFYFKKLLSYALYVYIT